MVALTAHGSSWQTMTCSSDLHGRVELWALSLRFDRVEVQDADMFARVTPVTSGYEVVQVPLPAQAEALHIEDATGQKLAPDIHLATISVS